MSASQISHTRRRWRQSVALLAIASTQVGAATPKVDFARMGSVAIGGSFAAFDFFDPSRNITFDPNTATLLSRSSTGAILPIAATSQGGRIEAACTLDKKLYVAGLFTTIGNTPANNIASWDLATGVFNGLGDGQNGGLDGEVSALYCDQNQKILWVGGAFKGPLSAPNSPQYGGAVAQYSPSTNSWSPVPFVGLNGAGAHVYSIIPSFSGSSLLFSGSFVTQYGSSITSQNVSNPNVPYSSGATPFTASLVPVPLANAEIQGQPAFSSAQFSSINNILCPRGVDGPGNTWRAQEGVRSVITARTFSFITASGIRLGNTFLDGRGVRTFSFTVIPSNDVVPLTYVDPVTQQTMTCTDACPLAHDPAIPYQDFLFPEARQVTGFQITIESWYGAGAGLHLMQLLSSGAFVSAVESQNTASCFAPGASQVSLTGTWRPLDVNTDIAGTTQPALVAAIASGTALSSAPSITWHPYISSSGVYNVYLMVPGCQNLQDCDQRTSVKVTVVPGPGIQPVETTVSQQVNDNTNQLVYSGPIVPSPPGYTITVSMTLADESKASGQRRIIADRLQFLLVSVGGKDGGGGGGAGTSGSGTVGFGLYESPLKSTGLVNATGVQSNDTLTPLNRLSLALAQSTGVAAMATTSFRLLAAVANAQDAVIVGGQFNLPTLGISNIAGYAGGAIIKLSGSGLNGVVNSIDPSSDLKTLYVGGAFTDTADNSGVAYRGVAAYDLIASSWSTLGGGVDGAVMSVTQSQGQVHVAGNFTRVFRNPSDTIGSPARGFASYDLNTKTWVNSGGFLVGSLSMSVAGHGNETTQYLAGSVSKAVQYGASGWALLQNQGDSQSSVVPASPGAQLSGVAVTGAASGSIAKRHHLWSSSTWLSTTATRMIAPVKRQAGPITGSSLPPYPATLAPAVLAGAFWTNPSSHELVVLAGNFSLPSGGFGLALYDTTSKTITSLKGNQVNGIIRTVVVSGDILYVGGDFTLDGVGSALALYDLAREQWITDLGVSLRAANNRPLVRSLSAPAREPRSIIVAGSFSLGGSQVCEAICSWDTTTKVWSVLGSGITGEVASVDYAGANAEILVVAGAFRLADGTQATVASFTFADATWRALPPTPGPITAVAVNNLNASTVYAAGRSSDAAAAFLTYWDGATWSMQDGSWDSTTTISQLKFVPLQESHTAQGAIDIDRMLFVSGAITSATQGTVASTLFDGTNFHPFLLAAGTDGSPGFLSTLFNSYSSFSFGQRKFLATGIVVLISLAIATGIVFFLLLLGILWTLCTRRDAGVANPNADETDDGSSFQHNRPSSLLEHINAATRTTILGSAALSGHHRKGDPSQDTHADADAWVRSDTPSDALGAGGLGGGSEIGDVNRPAHVRYSFAGGAEGELAVVEGQEVLVLDDRDQAWWYVQDPVTGSEGVVPASYLY